MERVERTFWVVERSARRVVRRSEEGGGAPLVGVEVRGWGDAGVVGVVELGAAAGGTAVARAAVRSASFVTVHSVNM